MNSTDETRAISCITNRMHDFRSCTYRGSHEANCDGNEYAWNEKHQREETTGRQCKGCRPREARHGLLCLPCWDQVVQALSDLPQFREKIRGITRAVQRDNAGIRGQSIGYVNLPGTLLALNEIWSYEKSMRGSADLWVSSEAGAMDARRFARAVSTAQRTHAVEEKAHPLRRLRCPACGQLTFAWNPPGAYLEDITVTCQNKACGKAIHEHDTDLRGEEKIAIVADIETRTA